METSSLESWVRATARAMLVHMDDIAERRREAFASSSSVRASRELGCAERALPLVCWSPTAGLRGAGIAAGVLEGRGCIAGRDARGTGRGASPGAPNGPTRVGRVASGVSRERRRALQADTYGFWSGRKHFGADQQPQVSAGCGAQAALSPLRARG
mgnify:CR=1 FL=1